MKITAFDSVEAEINHYTKNLYPAFASDLANARTSPAMRRAFEIAVSRNLDLLAKEMVLVEIATKRKAEITEELHAV